MNNKQDVIVSCWVNVCKVWEEVYNDLGKFVLKMVNQLIFVDSSQIR